MTTYTLKDGTVITKEELLRRMQLAENTEKKVRLFDLHMKELLFHVPLPQVPYDPYDIEWIWEDYKCSEGYSEIIGGKGRNVELQYLGSSEDHEATLKLIKNSWKQVKELYPIEITSHLVMWYSIFAVCEVDFPGCYAPTKQDYDYFFQLRGKERFEALEELIPKGLNFFTLIKSTCFKESAEKREKVIRDMLSDPKIIEQLKTNTFVVPVNLQFILRTPQVYSAYGKALLEHKKLPLPTINREAQKSMGASNPALQKALKQMLQLQKEGKTVEVVEKPQ